MSYIKYKYFYRQINLFGYLLKYLSILPIVVIEIYYRY